MSFVIDRFEGGLAAVQLSDGKIHNIPRAVLPADAKEGDVISITVDKKGTEEKKEKAKKLLNSLFDER